MRFEGIEWWHTPLDLMAQRYLKQDAIRRRARARRRWDRKHMVTVSVRIFRDERDAFRALCEERGLTVYGALRDFILKSIEQECLLV